MRNQTATTRLSETRETAFSYLNHPALRGCQSLSLELALNPSRSERNNKSLSDDDARENTFSSDTDASAEMSSDFRDREIDLSVKHDTNQSTSYSSPLEKLLAPDQQSSPRSSEAADIARGEALFFF